MKRIFTILFAATLAGQAWAQTTFIIDDLEYTVIEGTTNVSVCSSGEKLPANLVIPSEVEDSGMSYVVTTIADQAFNWCSELKSVTIPSTITTIGNNIFKSCAYITEIIVDGGNTAFSSENGVLFNKDKTVLIYYPSNKTGAYTIPNSVTTIGDGAFKSCKNLTAVTIQNSVVCIGASAFEGCDKLTSVTIPNSVTSIGEAAFKSCYDLATITLSNAITRISNELFSGCAFTSIEIPNGVTRIGSYAFLATDLTSLIIPNTVITIEERAFERSSDLETVVIPKSVDSIGVAAFIGNSKLTIYCEAEPQPGGWDDYWNWDDRPVEWEYDPNAKMWKVTVSANNAAYGSVSGGGTVKDSSSVTITATPAANYRFVKWSNGLTSATATITVTSDTALVAEFAENGGSLVASELHYEITSDSTVRVVESDDYATMTDVVIPETVEIDGKTYTVTSIGEKAFKNCYNLSSVTIPNTVKDIEDWAFYNCYGLESITIPNSVERIMYGAFEYCSSLELITIPESVTTIGGYVFEGCDGLTSITIPESVTSIPYGMFEYCDNLTTVSLPNTIEEVDGTAFEGCDKLEYNEYDSALYLGNAENPYVVLIKAKSTDITSCEINSKCKVISGSAFNNCKGLTSITVPNSVENIGYCAFSGCSSLESITLPFVGDKRHSFTDDHQYTFGYIFGNDDYEGGVATSQYYYNGDDGYHSTTYYIPSSLKSVVITDCEYIQFDAFDDCDNLTSITIPTSVTQIEASAFNGCSDNLTIYCDLKSAPRGWDLYLDSYNIVWGDVDVIDSSNVDGNFAYRIIDSTNAEIIDYLGSETEIVIPSVITKNGVQYTATRIGDNAFKSYNEMKSVTIPNTVTSIGNKAFSSCYNLKSVEIPNSVKTIGSYTFEYCGGLTSVVIPNSVTTFGKGAFYNCYNLTSVEIPNSITNISNSLFSYCSNLNSVTIPSSVTSIGYDAFSSCRSLATVDIPNSVTNIEESAFRWSGLTHIAIPSSITRLNGWTFDDCKNLEALIVPNSVTSTDWIVVRDCPKLTVYCEADSMPEKWDSYWNPDSCPVVWGADINSIFYLTVMPNNYEYGTVSGGGVVADGSSVTITATPADGYKFVKWSNGLTTATANITVASDTTIVAEFESEVKTWTVALSANNSAYGTVSGGGTVTDGSTVTITATSAANYRFVKWSNGLTSATATITVTSDTALMAEFEYVEPIMWTVTVSSSNREYGRASGSCTVADGSTITITATPAEGYEFVRWSNGLTNATETITVTSDLRLVAQFAEIVYAGTCGTDARWRFDMPTKTLTISGTGSIDRYKTVSVFSTEVDRPWQEIADQIEKVVIGEGITNLGSRAFCYLNNLKEVNISSTCDSYGGMSFADCPNLKKLVVATNSVYQANEYCFSNYDSCTVYVPAGRVDYYKKDIIFGMFKNIVGSYLVTIDADIKCGTVEVESYIVPEGGKVTVTPKPNEGYIVTDVTFKDDRGYYAFTTYTNGYQYWIENNAGSNIIVKVEFSRKGDSGFIYKVISGTNIEITKYKGTDSVITIPSTITDNGVEYTVTSIGDRAFDGNSDIKSVTIPNTVTNIGESAFSYPDLTSLTVPNSVKTIGEYAFSDVKNVVYNGSASGSPWGALTINGIVDGNCIFADAEKTHLTAYITNHNKDEKIDIPESVITIGEKAFDYTWATQYGDAYYFGNEENPYLILWRLANYFNDSVITSYEIKDGCKYIYSHAFDNQYGLESVTIPNSVICIGNCAFFGCNNLKSVVIPNSVKIIGDDVFGNCYELKSVTLGNSVIKIGNRAFCECYKLSSINIPNSVTTIGEGAFCDCGDIESITIPKSVLIIGSKTFSGWCGMDIYCEVSSKPDGWDDNWNSSNCPVFWAENTAVTETAANAVNIYAHGNTIVVENATDEISVYDAMGQLICRDAKYCVSTEIRVNTTGVYIVKVGTVTKRVMIE